MVRALCPQCRLPQVFRRMVRYIGTFLCGILITMIFVDVTKLFVARYRPNFLSVCKPLPCVPGASLDISSCTETDKFTLREARTSFPSFHAAITAYAGTFVGIYLHNIIRASSVRILKPFLALGFIMLSVMCCLARYGLYYSYWTDLVVGFGIGVIFALYMCISVLHQFRERLSGNRLYYYIRDFMFEQRALELRDLYKEERLPYSNYPGIGVYAGGIILPRPQLHANGQLNESNTDEIDMASAVNIARVYQPHATHSLPSASRHKNPRSTPSPPARDTFQRDLRRSLDHYRQNDFGHL